MFQLKYLLKNLSLSFRLIRRGEWRRVASSLYARFYLGYHHVRFALRAPWLRRRLATPSPPKFEVVTDHPVAFTSPDHLVPHGTRYNNSTNRKYVASMHDYCAAKFPAQPLRFMDLGCAGGQLVADFARLNWTAIGLEGSDYSLKHARANWRTLAHRNLFTCDVTKPFRIRNRGEEVRFHLITAWEVMEHFRHEDLEIVFENIRSHLVPGGLFMASTSSSTSIVDGVELHQTRMTNTEWRAYIALRFADLEPVDVGLKTYQYVRFDFAEASFLVYRKLGNA